MATWYYYNASGDKIEVTGRQLKELAGQGTVTPETFVETSEGRTGLAKNVKGLTFPEMIQPDVVQSETAALPEANPFTADMPSPFTQEVQAVPLPPPAADLFCTNCGNTVSEQAVACMSCGAQPAGHKKFCRHCGVGLNPEQVVCIKCGVSLGDTAGTSNFSIPNPIQAFQTSGVLLDAQQRKKRITLLAGGCIIFATLGLLVNFSQEMIGHYAGAKIAGQYQVRIDRSNTWTRGLLPSEEAVKEEVTAARGQVALFSMIFFVPLAIAFYCCYFFFVLRIWEEVPKEFARTTPATAAVFSLIPFFGYYWMFVALRGLYVDMNKATHSYGYGASYGYKAHFDGKLVNRACEGWLGLAVWGSLIMPVLEWSGIAGTGHLIIVAIGLFVGECILIPTYWLIQKNVLEFIDIKSGIGE